MMHMTIHPFDELERLLRNTIQSRICQTNGYNVGRVENIDVRSCRVEGRFAYLYTCTTPGAAEWHCVIHSYQELHDMREWKWFTWGEQRLILQRLIKKMPSGLVTRGVLNQHISMSADITTKIYKELYHILGEYWVIHGWEVYRTITNVHAWAQTTTVMLCTCLWYGTDISPLLILLHPACRISISQITWHFN